MRLKYLSSENSLCIPAGAAHGFQMLVDQCNVLYYMMIGFFPDLTDAVRFVDPAFGIAWPHPVTTIVERDRCCPDFNLVRHTNQYNATSQDRRAS